MPDSAPESLPNPFSAGIPYASSALLAALDEHIPAPQITQPADLATEEGRISLAQQAGTRELVDKLLAVLTRQRDEALEAGEEDDDGV